MFGEERESRCSIENKACRSLRGAQPSQANGHSNTHKILDLSYIRRCAHAIKRKSSPPVVARLLQPTST